MPTYEYECQACGEVHEIFHGITAEGPSECPSCGKGELKKLVSAGAGFIFKGSGFYTTDYRSKEYKDRAKKDKKDKGDSGGDAKSESKSGSESEKKSEKKSDSKSGSSSGSGSGSKND